MKYGGFKNALDSHKIEMYVCGMNMYIHMIGY